MERRYEALYIVKPTLTDADYEKMVNHYENALKESGATVEKVDAWGMQTLATEIDHQAKGYYVMMHFRAQPEQLARLDERFKLDKDVLRHRITRADADR